MSRRTKLLLTALFLALLSIPAAYIALTWHTVDPFRFRYVGQGTVVMRSVNPFGGGPEYAMVPVSIEVQNISKHSAYLQYGVLMAGQGGEPTPEDTDTLCIIEAIPRHSSVQLELMLTPELAQRIEREPFEVSYAAVSGTRVEVHKFICYMKKLAAWLFEWDVDYPTLNGESFVGELTKSPLPSPASASSSAPATPSQQHESPTDSPEGLPPPAPRVDTHPR